MAAEGMDQPWRRLEGKVVMVTGASSGIGRELSLDLARAGCKIVAAARRADRLKSLCDEINSFGSLSLSSSSPEPSAVRAVAIELDVSAKSSAIEASVQKAWDAFGRIDALINNAGIRGGIYSPLEWPEEEWNNVMATNLTGLWLVSKHVCKRMRDTKQKGSIINISSINGLERGQLPGNLAYSVSKTGVNAITRVMALELGVHNIRVNSISPGIFKSEITRGLMVKDWLDRVTKKTVPLKTLGTSDPALTSMVRYHQSMCLAMCSSSMLVPRCLVSPSSLLYDPFSSPASLIGLPNRGSWYSDNIFKFLFPLYPLIFLIKMGWSPELFPS